MSDDETIRNFEDTVNQLKTPYLNATEPSQDSDGATEADQDMSILPKIESQLDVLHGGIRELIENNGEAQAGGGLDKESLYQLFERRGIFTALKNNPGLKPQLLRSLHLMLKEYPFTRSPQHIHKVEGTPSYQIDIILNEE